MKTTRTLLRTTRHKRIRARVRGTPTRPRLSVFRSARHLTVQLIDDEASTTLVGVTDAHLPAQKTSGSGTASAGVAQAFGLGQLIAVLAKERGITRAVFDRGGYAYHGTVKAVAEGARTRGLVF